jgi:hypothetical protein
MAKITWIESHDQGMTKFTYDDEQRGLHVAVLRVPREQSPFSWIAALDGRPVGQGGSPALDDAGDAAMAAVEKAELARV